MRMPNNRTLVIVLVVLVVGWFVLKPRLSTNQLPWNQGQTGSIFAGGHGGGGQ